MYPQQIINALQHVRYPGTGKNLIEGGMLEDDIRISGMEVSFSLIFEKDNDPFLKSVVKAAETAIHTYVDENVSVHIHTKFIKQNLAPKADSVENLRAVRVIAIHSGKGGVGKSTVAANIAISLAKMGYRVGLLDADIHGPSIPKMFHTEGCRPVSTPVQGRNLIEPIEQYGVKMLSIGFFVDPQQAVVWRGGMASNAIKQLIQDANWGELDYFLIDLPPGTSDIHLTLVQHLQLTGAIVVTTPQPVALVDARKGVDMFRNEQVRSFVVQDELIELTLHVPYNGETVVTTDLADPDSFRQELGSLFREQTEKGVLEGYDFLPGEKSSPFDFVLPLILAGLVLLFVWAMFMGRMNSQNPLNSFGKARTVLGVPDGRKVTFDDVAGADEEKEELAEVVDFLRNPDKYTQIGARIPHGLLLVGPPGTGKTQTILNIIANLLVRGKTIQVVSNNNSATQNVLEKLSSPQYGLDFLVATLGKRENKEAFIDGQTGVYPDIAAWQRAPQELLTLKEQVEKFSQEVADCFGKQERLAVAKQELDALEVEAQYFKQYCEDSGLLKPVRAPRKGLKSETILHILQDCENRSEQNLPLSFWHKLKSSIFYGVYEWKFHKNDISTILTYLQSLFYRIKHTELSEEISSLQTALAEVDAKEKMDQMTKLSMEYLKAILYNRYGGRQKRPIFTMDAIWKTPSEILREYPIILSTTFSSRSCLKDATYDYLIMDEASQVDLATGALALASARCAVIVGDLKQLPNVIPENLRKQSEAVFQSYHLPDDYNYANNSFLKSICTVLPDIPQTLLREHYRCHPKIIGFCNQKFYQNQLIIMTEDHDEPDTLCVFRTVEGQHHRGHINQRQIDSE